MNKITEQDLVLYHYGELSGDESKAIRLLINSDQQLSAQYKELSLLLGAADEWKPANVAENFEQKIWKSVNKEIEASGNKLQVQRSSVSLWQRVSGWLLSGLYHPAPVLALVVVLVSVAYFTGRYDQHQDNINDPAELLASLSSETRDKILFQSVTSHLERSSRLLTTVSMGTTPQSEIDITEQKWARQLLMSNRLFSKAAKQSGQWRIVSLLDELEPILIEMANSSENTLSTREQIKQRIKSQKLIFKTKAFKTEKNPLI